MLRLQRMAVSTEPSDCSTNSKNRYLATRNFSLSLVYVVVFLLRHSLLFVAQASLDLPVSGIIGLLPTPCSTVG